MDSCILSSTCCSHQIPLRKSLSFAKFNRVWYNYFNLYRHDQYSLSLTVLLALYIPMYMSQLFTWIIFVVITCVVCHRSCHNVNKNNAQYSQLKKNLGILFLLFTFLGLPWLFIVTGSIVERFIIYMEPVVHIIVALQGPVLFVIRVARLKEARQFWKQLICCKFCNHAGSSSCVSCHK